MMPSTPHYKSVIVVGSGVFGASTSLTLAETHPGTNVTLIDACSFPSSRAASSDIGKIVRADYEDKLYARMALEAMQLWRGSPLYSRWYHPVGLLRIGKIPLSQRCLACFEALGVSTKARMINVEEAKANWSGVFETADFGRETQCYWQPDAGWADADKALKAVIQAAVEKGVKYRQATVSRIIIDDDGQCTGVQLSDGKILSADRVVLSTGAWTSQLLEKSAPQNKHLQAGGRLVVQGMATFYSRIPRDRWAEFKEAPVLAVGLEPTSGESLPLNGQGIVKFNCDPSFTKMPENEDSTQVARFAPDDIEISRWTTSDVPDRVKHLARRFLRRSYGEKVANIEPEAYRICWETSTPSRDFLISDHPHCKNLFLATGGGWHSWKMLPVLGKYVVRSLDGKQNIEEAKRWAWTSFDADGSRLDTPTPRRTTRIEQGISPIGNSSL